MNYHSDEWILDNVKKHLEEISTIYPKDHVVGIFLQGSQNYGLDEYSDNYCSDVDTKSIILPNLDDFIMAKQPISAVEVLENNEHAEVKDIRVMFEMFKKENISYIELLYSDYIVFIQPNGLLVCEFRAYLTDFFIFLQIKNNIQ